MTRALPSFRRLMQIQVETLFTLDRGRLRCVNERDGQPAPRFFLGRTVEGNQSWVRHDLPDDIAGELDAACRGETAGQDYSVPPYGAQRYHDVLQRHAPVTKTWAGPAYAFPPTVTPLPDVVAITDENKSLLDRYLPEWADCDASWQPMVVSLTDGHAVAVCGSARQGRVAHEAGVETAADFRRRGHATRVVTAWAVAVREMNRLPIYSTSWWNSESRGVAARLGLIQFGTDLHIT